MGFVLIVIGLLFQFSLVSARTKVISPKSAPWEVVSSTDYNAGLDQTVFSYKVSAYPNGKVFSFIVGIPSCPEIRLVSKSSYSMEPAIGFRGVKYTQDIKRGHSWTYTVIIKGLVETGKMDYVVEGQRIISGGKRTSKHEFSRGSILGPICKFTPILKCGISKPRYVGQCIGNTVRVPLISTAKHYEKLKWSTDYVGCAFTNTETANPVISFHGPICDTEFKVTLEVWGSKKQYAKCSTFITATDTTPPKFNGLYGPTDTTVACDDIPAPLHIVAKDKCDNDVKVYSTEVEEDNDNGAYALIRTYTAVDHCDNKATYQQKVIVADKQAPKLIGVPKDETVDCDVEVKPCVVTATDNCDDVTVQRSDQVIEGTCTDSWKIIRTWTSRDSSNNAVTAHQTVSVIDSSPPEVIGVPPSTTVDCHQVPADIIPSAYDNCQEDVEVKTLELTTAGSCPHEYTILRKYIVADECGNHHTAEWKVSVKDMTPPSLSKIDKTTVTVSCDDIPVPCAVDAVDNCATYSLSLVPKVETIASGCDHSYTLKYTWVAQDDCGLTTTVTKSVVVVDNTKPLFNVKVPQQLRTVCTAVDPVVVKATDNCGSATVDFTSHKVSRPNNGYKCDYDYFLYRAWSTSDQCGNTNNMYQTVHVVDDIPPVLIGGPPDMTLPCDHSMVMTDISVTASDNCNCVDGVTLTLVSLNAGSCIDEKTAVYRWSVSDCCGHEVSHTTTVTTYDTSPPRIIGVPGSRYLQIEDLGSITRPDVYAEDNCDTTVQVTSDQYTLPGSCPHNYKIVRTWNATDRCGNIAQMAQTIHCDDTTPPTLEDEKYTTTAECPMTSYPSITALDNSPSYGVDIKESRETVEGKCKEEYDILRHIVATDVCGNTAKKTYTIHVYDTKAPEWKVLPKQKQLYVIMDTKDAYAASYTNEVTAYDLCAGEIDVDFVETTAVGSCENEYMIRRRWSATDHCGNYQTITRTVDVQDQSPPSFGKIPLDTTVDCSNHPENSSSYELPFAEDYGYSGYLNVSTHYQVVPGQPCENSFTAIKCFTVSDCVGHTARECQTITVIDETPPEFAYVPKHETFSCDNVGEPVDITATDNCGPATVTRTESREKGSCDNEYKIFYTYVATDQCDLTTTYVQTVSVVDNEDPKFDHVPVHQHLECGSYSRYIPASCVDNCDFKVAMKLEKKEVSGTCEDEKTDIRLWTCTDNCGNKASASQSITYSDNEPPRFSYMPRDLSIPCQMGKSVIPKLPIMKAVDNCDSSVDIQLKSHDKPDSYAQQSSETVHVWIATDNCGNTAEVHQTVVVYDSIPPQVTVPASKEYTCEKDVVVPDKVVVTDNCDPDPKAELEVRVVYKECKNRFTKEYKWCPYDKSGNEGPCKTMLIIVSDTTPPKWDSDLPPVYQKVSYTNYYSHSTLTASDNCDYSLEVTWDENDTTELNCPLEKRVIYNYAATDICGNAITYQQTILVVDDVPPPLSPKPKDITLQCHDEIPSPTAVMSDDSYTKEKLAVTFSSKFIAGTCEQEKKILRHWSVKDCAGNTHTHDQTISIVDEVAPVLPKIDDKTLECEEDEYISIVATDECDDQVDIQFSSNRYDEETCKFKVARQWTATDDCGNSDSTQQTLVIVDETKPKLLGSPPDLTVDNHNIPVMFKISCSDNCHGEVFDSQFLETTIEGTCKDEFQVIRSWTCSDWCGQNFKHVQTIDVVDKESPVISYCPSPLTVEMGLVPPAPKITATDSQVYGHVDVKYDEQKTVLYKGHVQWQLVRTWTAVDNCQNRASCQQSVTVIDTVPPIIPDVPRDMYIDCDDPILKNWKVEYSRISKKLEDAIDTTEKITITPDYHTGPFPMNKEYGTCKGEFTVKRTWTATDHAGNTLSDTQVLTVVDDKPPTIKWPTPLQPNIHEECVHSAAPVPVVTDECDAFIVCNIHETRQPGTCPHEYTLIRRWDAQDNCGNAASAKQTVYVTDSQPPSFDYASQPDETVECSGKALPEPRVLKCVDECNGETKVVFKTSKHPGKCEDEWTVHRSWSCEDLCGHEVHQAQTVTIRDTTPPVFGGDYIAAVTIECEQDPPVLDVTATDECAEHVQVHFENIGYTVGYVSSTFVQKWSAFDNCGNKAEKDRTVTVVDTHDPAIDLKPPSITVSCDTYSHYEMPTPHCDDNCGTTTISRDVVTEPGTCEQEYDLIVKWTCVDAHSNKDTHIMTVSVTDNVSPSLNVKDSKVTVPCDSLLPPPKVIATDDCDEVKVRYTEDTIYGSGYEEAVSSPAVYQSGVTELYLGHFWMPPYYSVSPMIIPSFKLWKFKFNSVKQCAMLCDNNDLCAGAQLWGPLQDGPKYCYLYDTSAICKIQQVAYMVPVSQSKITYGEPVDNWIIKKTDICSFVPKPVHICDRYDLVRTWEAEDKCGNKVKKSHSIHVWDTAPPIFGVIPDDVTYDCKNTAYAPLNGDDVDKSLESYKHGIRPPTAVDDCSPKVRVVETVTHKKGVCDSNSITIFTWVAEDDCGNQASASMTMTKLDNTPPTIGYVELNKDVECVNPFKPPEDVTCTDDCNEVTVTSTSIIKSGTCDYIKQYTWVCEDACGNTATTKQFLHVADTVPPEFDAVPEDTTVDCSKYPDILNTMKKPTCVDACGGCEVSEMITKSTLNCSSSKLTIYRWIATDECGNKNEARATITSIDTTPPVISNTPNDETAECDTVYINPGVICTDDCGDCAIKFTNDITEYDCEETGLYRVVYRSWTGTDLCGHTTVETQTVSVVDRSPPTIMAPDHTEIDCNDALPVFTATADDDCGGVVLTDVSKRINGTCENNYRIVKTWIAVDRCGNKVTKDHTLTVTDVKPPKLRGIPQNVTVECDQIPDVPTVFVDDECSYPEVIFEEESNRVGYGCNNYQLIRKWSALDDCSNKVEAEVTITVQDNHGPTMTCNGADSCPEINVECEIYPPLPTIVAKDNCYEHLEVSYVTTPTHGSCKHDHKEHRVWKTDDACGHTATLTQVINYYDHTPPVLEGHAADTTIECPNSMAAPNVVAYDNCDYEVDVIPDHKQIPGECKNLYVEHRRWTATDTCGNSDWVAQTVTVVDNTPPVLDITAENTKVECDKLTTVWAGKVSATDNCDYDLSVKFQEEKSPAGKCEDSYTLIRHWSTVDCVGNTASHTQTIFVEDTVPPYFLGDVPEDFTVSQKDAYAHAGTLDVFPYKANDNCAVPVVKYNEVTVSKDTECDLTYYLVRTWSVVDNCGNNDNMVQTIDVVGTEPPKLEKVDDVTVECDSVPPPCDVKIIGKSHKAKISFHEVTEKGSCNNNYVIVRSWTATDCAHNSGSVVQRITVEDSQKPVFTRIPKDTTVECDCDSLSAVPVIDAVDNCDLGGNEVLFKSATEEGTCDEEYTLVRTWTAEDSCGNKAEVKQVVVVEDTTPPEFCDCPDTGSSMECDQVTALLDPDVSDDCDPKPTSKLYGGVKGYTPTDICHHDINYKWVAEDGCGNVAECQVTVPVRDSTPPVLKNGDKFCYPLNGYGPTENEWAVYNLNVGIIEVNDNCNTEVDIQFLSCNSTQHLKPGECEVLTLKEQLLFVRMTASSSNRYAGRYYFVWFRVCDKCVNCAIVKRTIWVPETVFSYEDAIDRGECQFGVGTNDLRKVKPIAQQ